MVLYLFFGISLTSCEKELYEEGIQNASRNISVKHVSLSSLDKTTSSKINEKINEIKSLKNKTNDQGKFQYNDALGVFIDTERGKLVNNDGKLYYTFPMFRQGEEKLENIIFVPLTNGEMETYNAKYNITPKEFKDITYPQIQNLNPEFQKMTVNGWYIMCVDTQESENVAPLDQGELMGNNGTIVVWHTIGSVCTFFDNDEGGGGGNGGLGYEGSENTGNNPTGNNSGGPHTGGGISTTPIGLSAQQRREKNFINYLDNTSQSDCFNSQSYDFKEDVYQYLEATLANEEGLALIGAETYPQDAMDFISDALQDICASGGSVLNLNPNPDELEDEITTDLPPCLEGLVNDLKSMQNGKLGEIMKKFVGVNPASANYNWKIQMGNLPLYNSGDTSPTLQTGYIALTTLNQNYQSISNDLSWARTIIHEAFHAYLVSVYRHRDIDKSYVNLIDTYINQFGGLDIAHHNIFASTNIINDISAALKEYGISKGYNLPQQFYDDMAWGGLMTTKAYSGISTTDQERIQSRLFAELDNSNSSADNINNTNPNGHPICP